MLSAIGASSLDELFDQIPAEVRLKGALDIPNGISEMEIATDLQAHARKNRDLDELVCFAGGGAYDHYVPALVWALTMRGSTPSDTSTRLRPAPTAICTASTSAVAPS